MKKKKGMTKVNEKSKEQAILEAAEQEFLEKGYDLSKTTRIASLAGVTHAMLHYYYRTKENLFDKVFDKKIKLLKKTMFAPFGNPDLSFLEKIKIVMEVHFDFLRENRNLPRFLINELNLNPQRMKLLEKKIKKTATPAIKKISEEIKKEVKKGTINPIDTVTLLIDIASLNVFVFAALPILTPIISASYESEYAFFEARKKENIKIIMKRLKK